MPHIKYDLVRRTVIVMSQQIYNHLPSLRNVIMVSFYKDFDAILFAGIRNIGQLLINTSNYHNQLTFLKLFREHFFKDMRLNGGGGSGRVGVLLPTTLLFLSLSFPPSFPSFPFLPPPLSSSSPLFSLLPYLLPPHPAYLLPPTHFSRPP